MTLPLTRRQEQLWRFIKSCDRSPTYDEMAVAMGLKSKSCAEKLVCGLKERGYVDYIPFRPRSIVALDPQERLNRASTFDLIAELERRGVMLELSRG
jgi:SOS-response transcriptional repressor LexA